MKVMGKKILVKQSRTKPVSEGGIALPDESIQVLPFGEILQLGSDIGHMSAEIMGEIVLFDPISAIPLSIKKDHVLIEPEDILAILEEGEY